MYIFAAAGYRVSSVLKKRGFGQIIIFVTKTDKRLQFFLYLFLVSFYAQASAGDQDDGPVWSVGLSVGAMAGKLARSGQSLKCSRTPAHSS
jgi:hypothetical protein